MNKNPKFLAYHECSGNRNNPNTVFIKKLQRSDINDLTAHLNDIEPKLVNISKISGEQDIIKLRAEINKMKIK